MSQAFIVAKPNSLNCNKQEHIKLLFQTNFTKLSKFFNKTLQILRTT